MSHIPHTPEPQGRLFTVIMCALTVAFVAALWPVTVERWTAVRLSYQEVAANAR